MPVSACEFESHSAHLQKLFFCVSNRLYILWWSIVFLLMVARPRFVFK